MTKHSLIAFTDTLRKEMYKYSIKVISIEPGAFRTQISSIEAIFRQLDNTWSQTSDEVKAYYESIEKQKELLLKLECLSKTEDNIDVAVDDMIDAVINLRPKLVYSPMNLWFRVVYFVLWYFPQEFNDWSHNFFFKLMREKLKRV